MTKKIPVFNYEICMACGICAQACPFSSLELDRFIESDKYKHPYPELARGETCTGCGICAKCCPVDVIEIKEIS